MILVFYAWWSRRYKEDRRWLVSVYDPSICVTGPRKFLNNFGQNSDWAVSKCKLP
jgi:hypothetical protein